MRAAPLVLVALIGCEPAPGPTASSAAPTTSSSEAPTQAAPSNAPPRATSAPTASSSCGPLVTSTDAIRYHDGKLQVGDHPLASGEALQGDGKVQEIDSMRAVIEATRCAQTLPANGAYRIVLDEVPPRWVWQSVLYTLGKGRGEGVEIDLDEKRTTARFERVPSTAPGIKIKVKADGKTLDLIEPGATSDAPLGDVGSKLTELCPAPCQDDVVVYYVGFEAIADFLELLHAINDAAKVEPSITRSP